MITINQKCNQLGTILGLFCHACHTPEKVVEALTWMGITISVNGINNTITLLSQSAVKHVHELGQTLLAGYAYDNFDIDLKSTVPTAEKSATSLVHLTSGLLFPLPPEITLEDMRCSAKLWEKSRLNPDFTIPMQDCFAEPSWKQLYFIHQHALQPNDAGLTPRHRFNTWMYLTDLCTHGPAYFHKFLPEISAVEPIEQIPLHKTQTVPVYAMEYVNSTVAGNISSIEGLLAQAGLEDPTSSDVLDFRTESDILDHFVILFHGDLGTGERILAAQNHRSVEDTPRQRLQHTIFVLGLLHLKMACADAVWRIFIKSKSAREDQTSLMEDIGILRPHETGIISSKPGFCRMHEIIQHAGLCRRLDCWRVEMARRGPAQTLEDYAKTKPSLSELWLVANHLALNYTATEHLRDIRRQPINECDQQYENALLLNRYFLLYEELSYSMNLGDIGRVESCFQPWLLLFKATGKHKYAKEMIRHISNVHLNYSPGLR